MQNLQNQLRLLREGRLHSGPGTTFEPVEYLDARIREQTDRRDRLQLSLDAQLTAAATLLDAPVTTSR